MPRPLIPSPAHPLVQPESGRVTPPWYQYLWQLLKALEGVTAGGAPADGGYVIDVANPNLPTARVATDSLTVQVDLTEPGVMRWHVGGYWTPITNGDPLSPEILFDAVGDCVVGFVPTPEAP